ncbi:MAG: hypothetical protein R3E68_14610 [Burkholderiaceae bacterium]
MLVIERRKGRRQTLFDDGRELDERLQPFPGPTDRLFFEQMRSA